MRLAVACSVCCAMVIDVIVCVQSVDGDDADMVT
jgi:hypothetical protein